MRKTVNIILAGLAGVFGNCAFLCEQARAQNPIVGDIRRSGANISKIQQQLQYEPTHGIAQGLGESVAWYVEHSAKSALVEESRVAALT